MPNDIDFLKDALAGTGKDPLPMFELARDMVKLEKAIAVMEWELSIKKAELLRIQRETMPDLMRASSVEYVKLAAGWALSLKPLFSASLPSASSIEKASDDEAPALLVRYNDGIKWIEKNKGADIIQDIVSVQLGKGQADMARKVVSYIKSLQLTADRTRKVHPSTLKKFLREKLAAGAKVPMDTFAVFSGEMAEVIQLKESKK